MIFWEGQQAPRQRLQARALLYSYFLFMAIVSFSTQLTHSIPITIAIYLGFSAVLLASPLWFEGSDRPTGKKEAGA
jgi:hypothetical protein